jgi:hypothetical protein
LGDERLGGLAAQRSLSKYIEEVGARLVAEVDRRSVSVPGWS